MRRRKQQATAPSEWDIKAEEIGSELAEAIDASDTGRVWDEAAREQLEAFNDAIAQRGHETT